MILEAGIPERDIATLPGQLARIEMTDYHSKMTTFITEDGVVERGFAKDVKIVFEDGSGRDLRIYIEDEQSRNNDPKQIVTERADARLDKLLDILVRMPQEFYQPAEAKIFYIHLKPKAKYRLRNDLPLSNDIAIPIYDFDALTAGEDGPVKLYERVVKHFPWHSPNVTMKTATAEDIARLSEISRKTSNLPDFTLPSSITSLTERVVETTWDLDMRRKDRVFDKINGFERILFVNGGLDGRKNMVTVRIEAKSAEMFERQMEDLILPVLKRIPSRLFSGVKFITLNKNRPKYARAIWSDTTRTIDIYGYLSLGRASLKSVILHEMGHTAQLSASRTEVESRTALAIAAGGKDESRYNDIEYREYIS